MSLQFTELRPDTWKRVFDAVELVHQRLARATQALESAGIPYAIAGGNAVAAWVAQVDREAVRSTKDVDIIVRQSDLDRIKIALERVGFVFRHAGGLTMFLDGPDGSPRTGIHLLFEGTVIKEGDLLPVPLATDSTPLAEGQVLRFDSLVRYKLVSYRDKDRTHLRDMIDVGLLDASWLSKLPAELAKRLKFLIDNPE